MVITQNRSKRKSTGGRYGKLYRSKRKYEIGRDPAMTSIASKLVKVIKSKCAKPKQKMTHADKANVIDPKTKKAKVVDIKNVVENPANLHFVRRNVITKGSVIETSAGKARVTSRPGQDGTVNAVLL